VRSRALLIASCLLAVSAVAVGLAQDSLTAPVPPLRPASLGGGAALLLDLSQPMTRDGVGILLEGVALPGPDGKPRYEDAIAAIHAKALAVLGIPNTPESRESLGGVVRIIGEETRGTGALVVRAGLDLRDAVTLVATYGNPPPTATTSEGPGATTEPTGTGGTQPPAGQESASVDELLAGLRSEPRNAVLYNRLGLTYAATGKIDEALIAFQRAAELFGADKAAAEPRCNIAAVYFSRGRYGDALKQYKLALQVDPDFALAHYGAGAAYEALGESGQARSEYTAYLVLESQGPMADAARAALARLVPPPTTKGTP